MSELQTLSVSLTPSILSMIEQAVQTGDYETPSEVVREALRAWKIKRFMDEDEDVEEIRRALQEDWPSVF